ncbi:MAG: hypothetical protein ACRD12_23870 [Acidimicrobiales bacterium]
MEGTAVAERDRAAVTDRRVAVAIGAFGVLWGLPFVLLGPKFVLDDWFTRYWAWQDGWWRAAGPTQPRARPLGALIYTIEFGVIGDHPGVIAAVQVGLSAATAVLFFVVCRRFLSRWISAAVAVTWLILGNHSALDHWASGMIAQVALLLLLAGVLLLIRTEDAGRPPWPGTVLVAVSALSYEATILAAAAAVVAVPLLTRRRLPWRRLAWQLGIVGATGAYLVAASYHFDNDQGWLDVGTVFNGHFGSAVLPSWGPVGAILALGAAIGVVTALVRPLSPRLRDVIPAGPSHLVVAGVAVIAIGLAPFIRYPISVLGVGDRANVVAALGTALAWVGLAGMLAGMARGRTAVLVVAGAVLATGFAAQGIQRDLDWHRAMVDTDRTLAAMAAKAGTLPPGTLVVAGPTPRWHHGITGLIGSVPWHLQAYTGIPGLDGEVATTAEAFNRVPPEHRVEIEEKDAPGAP